MEDEQTSYREELLRLVAEKKIKHFEIYRKRYGRNVKKNLRRISTAGIR